MPTEATDRCNPKWWQARTADIIEGVSNVDSRRYLKTTFQAIWARCATDWRMRAFADLVPRIVARNLHEDFKSSDVTATWLRSLLNDLYESTSNHNLKPQAVIVVLDFLVTGWRLGFHADIGLFSWMDRNGHSLLSVGRRSIRRRIEEILVSDDAPPFELVFKKVLRGGIETTNVTALRFDTDSTFVRSLLVDALNESTFGKNKQQIPQTLLTSEFIKSLGFEPTSLADFTVDTFSSQFRYFDLLNTSENARSIALQCLTHLYIHIIKLLPEGQTTFTFETGLPLETLTRSDFTGQWRAGFRPCVHNRLDPTPKNPKWLLFPSADELSHTCTAPRTVKVDTSIDDLEMQRMLSSWLWEECGRVETIYKACRAMKPLIQTFSKMTDGDRPTATVTGLMRWCSDNKWHHQCPRSQRFLRHRAESILDYGRRHGYIDVEPSSFVFLSTMCDSEGKANKTAAADKNDLKVLASELESRIGGGGLDELIAHIFYAIALTGLRLGNILSLRIGDLLEDTPRHIHAVRVSTKSDGNALREIQVKPEVYRRFREVIRVTEQIRPKAPKEIRDHLFIYEARAYGAVKRITNEKLRDRLYAICDELGIGRINARDIRRRYQTEVVLRGIENNYSRLAIGSLTGHASLATTERYYVRDDIRNYLEAAYGIEIGVPTIKGEILPDGHLDDNTSLAAENAVESGAGYCRNETCNVPGTLSCLMCRGFLTTPRCIPEMEEALENIQRRIRQSAETPHDREHLQAVKRLYLGYLAVMYSMEEA